jgi:DNA-binding NtrC family response regulator
MAKEGTILVIDDNKSILSALEILLGRYFEKVVTIPDPNRIPQMLRDDRVDVALLDMNFTTSINTGNEGIFWLGKIKEQSPDTQVVLFTAYADVDLAVKGIKQGAADFVVKPWDNDKLVAALQNAYILGRSKRQVQQLKQIKNELQNTPAMFWGTSEAMKGLRETVDKVAKTDANILITGENGTGKEMLAREIHRKSARSNELMVSVDMGSLTETLFESELFGHVKGAFTDAKADRAGKFEVADHGTLFLDEIGNLPYHLQSKLLTVIQSGKVVRVGSNEPIPVDIRLICATNADVFGMVREGKFREDLMYRINTIHLDIPPLRQRREDIIPLAEIFLKQFTAKYGKQFDGFDDKARAEMEANAWNGNIRELQHTVEKAVILGEGRQIASRDLFLGPVAEGVAGGVGGAGGIGLGGGTDLSAFTTLEQMEREMIKVAMDRNGGNLSAVAQQLGITRQTLYNKIRRYEL